MSDAQHDRGRPTFVLGLGAQKAGTTWLSGYLGRSPEFEMGFRKEYHVLDSLDLATEEWMRAKVVRLARRSMDAFENGGEAPADVVHRLAMLMDLDVYYDYFAGILHRPGPVRATGDLTPDHSMLGAERLAAVRAAFDEREIRTAAVLVLRDPVERVWSHIRMKMHRAPHRYSRSPEEELRAEYADPRYVRRTRYEQTLAALDETFPAADAHVGLYETLFADPRQARAICDVVGISRRRPNLDRRRNSSPRGVSRLPEDIARPVAELFAETYREVARLRPELDIEQHWPHAHWVL